MALLATLSADEDLPPMVVDRVGVGAGSRDTPGRANVKRVVVGERTEPADPTSPTLLLEANVDDLDPRLWPGVLEALIRAGADDAWLVPIAMKKGAAGARPHRARRPAPGDRPARAQLALTTTFGVR